LNSLLKKNQRNPIDNKLILEILIKNIKEVKCEVYDSMLYFHYKKESKIEESSGEKDSKMEESNEGKEKHKLTIEIVEPKLTKESFALYKKYQMNVHKDKEEKLNEDSYKNFLVNSPLYFEKIKTKINMDEDFPIEGISKVSFSDFSGYGSYHVQYRLDGKLVMVAVIDILPKCISSVYVYYDPDYEFLSLGVYSAIAEIFYAKLISKVLPDLHYYYLGFYIHNIQKMKYKAQYEPSELLCPLTYKYHLMKDVLKLVDHDTKVEDFSKRVLRFSDQKLPSVSSMDNLLCFYEGKLYRFKQVIKVFKDLNLKIYHELVGGEISSRVAMLIKE
jgi:arginyl-tRNA--protein-N-Asp/Glu arginylyltransferase